MARGSEYRDCCGSWLRIYGLSWLVAQNIWIVVARGSEYRDCCGSWLKLNNDISNQTR